MSSPFPGMNPYLEQADVWHDFHQRFAPRIGDAIASALRPNYFTKVDENVYAAYIYRSTPRPPLFSSDAEWASQLITQP